MGTWDKGVIPSPERSRGARNLIIFPIYQGMRFLAPHPEYWVRDSKWQVVTW